MTNALRACDRQLPLGRRTYLLGILNVTDDSFSGDGLLGDHARALEAALRMAADGADIIDVGGESARADVRRVTPDEEIARVVPVIRGLRQHSDVLVSIDTYKPEVARAAIEAGAHLVNDISGLRLGDETARVAAQLGAALVVNYTYERPKIRPDRAPRYHDLVGQHLSFLRAATQRAHDAGLPPDRLIIDPGIAFGKSHDEDLEVLRRLREFRALGYPLLLAASRKHFIGSATGLDVTDRLEATLAVTALAIAAGADFVRVHDVLPNARTRSMTDAIVRGHLGDWAATPESWPWAAGARSVPGTRIGEALNPG